MGYFMEREEILTIHGKVQYIIRDNSWNGNIYWEYPIHVYMQYKEWVGGWEGGRVGGWGRRLAKFTKRPFFVTPGSLTYIWVMK